MAEAGTAELYSTIRARRDVRGQFTGEAVDEGVLERILEAAHAAPSVGLSQPWDFIVIDDDAIRRSFWEHVQTERAVFAASLPDDRRRVFDTVKIEGVLDASIGMVVTYDPERGAPNVLGRHAIEHAGLYSVCLAIQNLWLAATCEGWGVGWVSFYREGFLGGLLGVPERVRPVAWLCLGPVTRLEPVPDLEAKGWRSRCRLEDVVHRNRW